MKLGFWGSIRNQLKLGTVLENSAPAVTYTISGTVYEADGSTAVQGATVALGAYTATTAANGTYTISGVPAGTSGSMTCTKTGYTWTAITVNAMAGNLTNQNYTATQYDFNFASFSNGALPSGFTGATWSITSGQASNSPTLGAELLTDGGLEATYTAGLCGTLTKAGSPTLAESADAHGGSKAQQFAATLNSDDVHFAAVGSLTGKWLQYSGWGKRTAGNANKTFFQRAQNGFPSGFAPTRLWNDATYTQKITVFKAYAASFTGYAATSGANPNETVIVDDFSLKEITASEMYASRSWTGTDGAVRVYLGNSGNNGSVGIVARLDSTSNPQNYILVGISHDSGGSATLVAKISMAKVVAGTLTVLITPTTLGALVVNGDYVDLVCSGNDFSMYYNGVQKGTTQTVTGMTGTKFGFWGAGGALVNRFFLGASL